MTKHELAGLLFTSADMVKPVTIAGITGIFQGASRESGSGRDFNVTILPTDKVNPVHVYIRTID